MPTSIGVIQSTGSAFDNFQAAAVDALSARAGHGRGQLSQPAQDLYGKSLIRLGEEWRALRGLPPASPDDIARMMLGADVPYGTAGDFPNILSGLARKVLESPPQFAETTYQHWAKKLDPLKDFKPTSILRVSEFTEFPTVPEGDDFTQSKMVDSLAGWLAVDQYGDEFALTPRMVLDDDIGAFSQALQDKQAAHDQTLNRLCVKMLIENVVLADSYSLFDDSNHLNDIADGGVPSTGELSKMRLKLRKQTGLLGTRKLSLPMTTVIVPEELETTTQQVLDATLNMVANTEANTSIFRGKVGWFVEPILAEFSTTKWYGFSARRAAIVYAHQVGFETMKTRNYYNPKNNSQVWQFEGRFCAAAIDHRGVVRNSGEASGG